MVKNLIVFALLIAACTAFPHPRISEIGNILTKGLYKVRYLGSELIHARNAAVGGNKIIFKFPENPSEDDYVIRGIKTVGTSMETKMQIIDGGIGKPYATIAVTLPEKTDIDTEFHFYGDAVKPEEKKGTLESIKSEYKNYKKSQQIKTISGRFDAIKQEYEEYKSDVLKTSGAFDSIREEYEEYKKAQDEAHKEEAHKEEEATTKSSTFDELREEHERYHQQMQENFH